MGTLIMSMDSDDDERERVQHRVTHIVLGVDVRPSLDQELGHCRVTIPARPRQRTVTTLHDRWLML